MTVLTICPVRGCRRLTTAGRCAEHRRARRAERQRRPIERIYESSRWRKLTRPTVLDRDGHRCVSCGASPAETRLDVAHRLPTQEILAAGLDPFDPELCETRCSRCHGAGALRPT